MILGGRRVPPHPARQQQRLVPGQSRSAGSTGRFEGAERRLPPVRPDDDRLPEGPSGAAAPHVFHGRARRTAAGDRLARHRAGQARLFVSDSHALALALDGRRSDRPNLVDRDIYVAMNAWSEPLEFKIPAAPSGRPWRRVVDTALPSPEDIMEEDQGPRVPVLANLSSAITFHDHSGVGGNGGLITPSVATRAPQLSMALGPSATSGFNEAWAHGVGPGGPDLPWPPWHRPA